MPKYGPDFIQSHEVFIEKIVKTIGWILDPPLLSYEHTERQRQGPLERIVALENGGGRFSSIAIDQHYMTLTLPLSLDAWRSVCLHP